MQIHDWTRGETDISLTTFPATDSRENRMDTHTHTPHWVSLIQSEMSGQGRWEWHWSIHDKSTLFHYVFLISQHTDMTVCQNVCHLYPPLGRITTAEFIIETELNKMTGGWVCCICSCSLVKSSTYSGTVHTVRYLYFTFLFQQEMLHYLFSYSTFIWQL